MYIMLNGVAVAALVATIVVWFGVNGMLEKHVPQTDKWHLICVLAGLVALHVMDSNWTPRG